jgi:hypothetical protein
MAYNDTVAGIPTGHLVGFDACASGLQIMAALTGCETTARNTGLIGQKRMDMYGECTKEMSSILGSEVEVSRKLVKSAQMPHFYGSKMKPQEVFGPDTAELRAFYLANNTVAPGACELLEVLLDCQDKEVLSYGWQLPDGYEAFCPTLYQKDSVIEVDELDHASFTYRHTVNCTLGEAIDHGYTKKGNTVKSDPSTAANPIHSLDGMVVREMCRRCNYDKMQLNYVAKVITDYFKCMPNDDQVTHPICALATESGFVSLVGVEYVDGTTVAEFSMDYLNKLLQLCLDTLQHKSFPLICIHDEFKAHANNINTVRQTYTDIMAEIADSNMLGFILSQLKDYKVEIGKYSEGLGDLIRQSEYALS